MVRVDIIKVVSEWCWFCGNALGKLQNKGLFMICHKIPQG